MKILKKLKSIPIAVVVSLFFVSLALAASIIVDGVGTEWPGAALEVTDPNDGGVADASDIGAVYSTNSSTTVFWRFDTYANTDYSGGFSTEAFAAICMDIDNNDSTGGSFTGNCKDPDDTTDMVGIDFIVIIDGTDSFDSTLNAFLYNCGPGVTNVCPGPAALTADTGTALWTVASQGYAGTTITEVGITENLLDFTGFNFSACDDAPPVGGCPSQTALYFDTGDGSADDTVPRFDNEYGENSTTAISLVQLESASSTSSIGLILLSVVFLCLAGIVLVRLVGARKSSV